MSTNQGSKTADAGPVDSSGYALKPCPFCGDSTKKATDPLFNKGPFLRVDNNGKWWKVCCETCNCQSGESSRKNLPVEAWNRRA
jgi:hypothetical protein